MTTGRWRPSATYSDSVRDQPAAPSSARATLVATATATTTPPVSRYPGSLRDPSLFGPPHTRSSGPIISRAAPSSSDIPVNPAIVNRINSPSALFSPSEARRSSAVDDQPNRPTRKRGRPPIDFRPAKHHQPDLDRSSPPTTEHSAHRPAHNVSYEEYTQYTSQEQSNRGRPTRGSRACTVCRRLKMRCVGAEDGPPCKRCRAGNHECIFEESMRGKKGTKRTDQLARNLQSVELKLDAMMSEMKHHASMAFASQPNNSLPISPLGDSSQGLNSLGAYGSSQHANATQAVSAAGSLGAQTAGTQHPANFQASPPDSAPQPTSEPGQAQPLTRFGALPDFTRPLPDNTLNPLGLLAEASLRSRHDRTGSPPKQPGCQSSPSPSESSPSSVLDNRDFSQPPSDPEHHDTDNLGLTTQERMVGIANAAYFQPGAGSFFPLRRFVIEQRMPPSLLTDKILTNEEVVELFEIFFERCNPHCCILEPKLHTPTVVGNRSPFLFTAICAVSSRYYEKRKELHLNCLQAANRIAFDVMVKGYKSVEVVQAFLLLSLWNQPAERFEEDRTWAFSGIAIRMAIDLNLHRKTTLKLAPPNSGSPRASTPSEDSQSDEAAVQQQEMCERESLNRERTWLHCFILDRSLSAQMGKPYSIREDFIIRSSKTWHKSRYSAAEDSGITTMVDLHRIHSRIIDTLYSDIFSSSGLNANLDYSLLMKTFSQSLDQWMTECTLRIDLSQHDPAEGYRQSMKDFYYNYYRLFTMSFMIQHALENPDNEIELPQLYLTCYDAATSVITIACDRLGPSGALRYAPDNQFVYITYAAVFLLKLIRPQLQSFSDGPAIRNLVHECIVLLEEVSVDETHTPALYAAFLRVLLNSKNDGSHSPTQVPGDSEPSRHDEQAGAEGEEGRREQQARSQKRPAEGGRGAMEPLYPPMPHGAKDATSRVSQPIEQRAFEGIDVEASESGEDNMAEPHHSGNDNFVDSLLKDGGFWDSMLMPGYSGPLNALLGGAGMLSQFECTNAQDQDESSSVSPSESGRATPNPVMYFDPDASGQTTNDMPGLEFGFAG